MKDIYLGVKKSIEDLQNIFKNADDKDEKLKRFNQEALELFQKLESESLKELESLKNNEEWENFTIAFYGETGAGKSTLIECLRLFFKEQSKMDQQERFKRLDLDYQEKCKDDKRLIEQYDTEISDFQKTLQDLENELISLKKCNIFFKIFHFLTGNRKFKEISKCFQKSQDELNNIELKKENHISEKQNILNELHSLQDGAIIGDGRSDFTLKTRSYPFQYNHQNFTLLDVPGIEGNEKKVIDQISNATQKAHAIFYVTKTPNPPQKGEERKEGTIEKIQRQLDSQTEVWTIYNKPITSPRALKDELINENEKESLKILDEKMKGILGKHYKGHKVVSAQAAFYGLSQALIPETDFDKKKQKFLKDFRAGELLYQSHFKLLAKFIAEELLENSRAKIIQSNCNKALKVVEELQNTIKTTIEKRIDPEIKETQEHQQEARFNLDRSKEKFISDLEKSAFSKIDQFKSDFRIEMHERIERGIGNNECKEIFENELKQRQTKLIEDIERRFKECEEQFRGSVGKNIEQYEERVKDSLAIIKRINNLSLNPNADFNMDSGIDTIGLLASIGGLVLLLLTPIVGKFALIAGVGLALVGICKALWGFFDSDYKKSQQRKEVDKNLDEACEKIAENVKSRIENYKKGALGMIEELNAGFNKLVDHYERMKGQLKEAHEKLGYISNSINLTISKQGACNEE
ncbi:GTPase [Helicobacter pylori]